MAFETVNLAQIYGAVDRDRANRMQMERFQRQNAREEAALAEQDAIRGVYRGAIGEDGSLDQKRLLSDLYRVAPEKALEAQQNFQKMEQDQRKGALDISKAQLEQKKATAAYLRDRLAAVTDDASYQQVLQEANELGAGFVKTAPPQFDPNWVRSNVLTADKFLEQMTPKYERVDLGGKVQVIDVNPFTNPSIKGTSLDKTLTPEAILTDKRTRSEGAANREVTLRGQNLNDARGRESNEISRNKTHNEKLTEGMRSTGQYAARMVAAEKLLEATTEQKPGVLETVAGGLPFVGTEIGANLTRSPDRQKALQAQRDWVRAKLRKESGAVIGEDEMKSEIATYFPQIGDSPEVIAQKKIARQQAVDGLIGSAGGAYTPPNDAILPKGASMTGSGKLKPNPDGSFNYGF